KGQYLRTSIIDLMPDPVRPLYATLGLSAINQGLQGLMKDIFGAPSGTLPDETMMTINGYAYMDAGYTPKQILLLIRYMVPKFGRLLRTGVRYWQEEMHPAYVETADRWEEADVSSLAPSELLVGVREVVEEASQHLGSLMVSTMGPSAGAEALFTNVYEKLVRKKGDPPAPALLLGFDNIPLEAEKTLYDLAQWTKTQPALASYLAATPTEAVIGQVEVEAPPAEVAADLWIAWCRRFQAYLHDYGYAIYYLDFTRQLPMDDPVPAIEALKLYITGQGRSPYERQQAFETRRETALASIRARIKGLRAWAFEKTLTWAQRQVPLREDGIAEIGRGYPVLRDMLRELGRRFMDAGALVSPEDIFWMEIAEVEAGVAALEAGRPPDGLVAVVEERKAQWRAQKRVTPPPMLPPKSKYMGIDVSAFTPEEGNVEGTGVIKGLGASPGRVTAPARVLHGPEDFDQMQAGDVLVASMTTPAWTPLFAMAAGVVTDIGGPLSHGSIVAREYGIPAVMGTGSATKLIHSGQTVTVVGDTGEVLLGNGNAYP
ncbi:MAG: phosphoenolpyruvate synthase, partial [Anaerolineae bacterium]|nr:phosphoenolpyruvate synthase [Anaerolineae bacterium]